MGRRDAGHKGKGNRLRVVVVVAWCVGGDEVDNRVAADPKPEQEVDGFQI